MKPFICALVLALATFGAGQAPAQESAPATEIAPPVQRVTLGWGRLFSNDIIGDGRDRWRTGSYTVSRVRGTDWTGSLPTRVGEIIEFRFRAETLAPANITAPAADDRRYAGVLSFGLHTHFDLSGFDTAVGMDMVVTGPQTGMGRFHRKVHDLLGMSDVGLLPDQIVDDVHPTLVAEMGRSLGFGPARIRPFAEVQAGAETMVRVGADLDFGGYSRGALMLRDSATGQRYRAVVQDRVGGISLTMGGDIARVSGSAYLPEGGAATLSDTRERLRAGLHWQGDRSEMFYGLTWLGKEFEQQPEGQLLGSLNIRFQF